MQVVNQDRTIKPKKEVLKVLKDTAESRDNPLTTPFTLRKIIKAALMIRTVIVTHVCQTPKCGHNLSQINFDGWCSAWVEALLEGWIQNVYKFSPVCQALPNQPVCSPTFVSKCGKTNPHTDSRNPDRFFKTWVLEGFCRSPERILKLCECFMLTRKTSCDI